MATEKKSSAEPANRNERVGTLVRAAVDGFRTGPTAVAAMMMVIAMIRPM